MEKNYSKYTLIQKTISDLYFIFFHLTFNLAIKASFTVTCKTVIKLINIRLCLNRPLWDKILTIQNESKTTIFQSSNTHENENKAARNLPRAVIPTREFSQNLFQLLLHTAYIECYKCCTKVTQSQQTTKISLQK